MSALGHKRTWRLQFAMSAFHPIADIEPRSPNVCFVPIADINIDKVVIRAGALSAAV
jgi:hypothetical protein